MNKSFNELKKNLKKEFDGLRGVKIALLGDSATQLFAKSLRAYGYEEGLDLTIYEADYNQIERTILDPDSSMYEYDPQFVIVFQSPFKLLGSFYKYSGEKSSFFDTQLQKIMALSEALSSHTTAKMIYLNVCEINDSVFGNFSNKTELSFLYQVRMLNLKVMEFAMQAPNLFVADVNSLQSELGKEFLFDAKMRIHADVVFSLDFLPVLSKRIIDIVLSLLGKFRKCLILDLDNTTWGGVIGDDGLENIQIGDLGIGKAFSELQLWAKQLKERGIILAICSKNTDAIAREPFLNHPDMILRMEDIAVFVANWENKVANIQYIQSVLNIGFDSMVFLDDNPFERNIVRENIEDIIVPELPEDPAEYLPFLYSLNLFETASFSENDQKRTKQYQVEAKRREAQNLFSNEGDFLHNLNMTSDVQHFSTFNIPRVAQLTQRSNQFNLRTVRYTEQEIRNIAESNLQIGYSFTLEDRFGDNGLISVVILEKQDRGLFIDTWIMSCRVLKRGMEKFVLNIIAEEAKLQGYSTIIGEYLPTKKNELVKDHYKELGFSKDGSVWTLNLNNFKKIQTYIQAKEKIK